MKLRWALAVALGTGAVGLQWAWATKWTNGWFCTGRLACYLWTRANLPAYMIADIFAGGETDRFWPIALGILVQWTAIGLAIAWLLAQARRARASRK